MLSRGEVIGVSEKEKVPGMAEIAADIKELGRELGRAFKAASESKKARQARERIEKELDSLDKGMDKIVEDAKSGKLVKNARHGLHSSLKSISRKLKDCSDSLDSEKK